ncbi:MAG: hypothetical protein JW982_15360 [Spirochaetes bacterium]|nr:hypothetical protein [Spirochaetota bacterium]
MKKYLLLFIFIILLSAEAFAQNSAETDFDVKIYPFPLFIGMISAEGEYLWKDQFTFCCDFRFLRWDIDSGLLRDLDLIGEKDSWTLTYFSLGPGIRWYPMENSESGLFLGAFLDYVNVSLNYEHDSGHGGSASSGGLSLSAWAGYKKTFSNFVFEISTGCSYTYLKSVSVKYENEYGSLQVIKFPFDLQGFLWNGIGIGAGAAF